MSDAPDRHRGHGVGPVDVAVADVFLAPGDYFVGDASRRVGTLLGSCVSITLWHARWRLGAMSHCLLAERGARNHGNSGFDAPAGFGAEPAPDARYCDEALELMLRNLASRGVAPHDCVAKIFGGGDMFPGQSRPSNVGQRNGDAAHELLVAHGIPVVSASLFGVGHRRIVFDIASGDVWSCQTANTADKVVRPHAGKRNR